ncbi:MAG: hypothetical protein ACK557_17180 [Planctomycetota bacterium]
MKAVASRNLIPNPGFRKGRFAVIRQFLTCLFLGILALSPVASMAAVPIRGISVADKTDEDRRPELAEPTHKQVRAFQPLHAGKPIHLNTFCLDREGNIVAAVGGNSAYEAPAQTESGEQTEVSAAPVGFVQIYSPDWQLLKEIPLEFQPTAVNFDSSGNLYVGGDSMLCKFSPEGDLVAQSTAPNLEGRTREELEAEARKSLEAQAKQMTGIYESQLEQIEAAIAARKASETPESGDSDQPAAEENAGNKEEEPAEDAEPAEGEADAEEDETEEDGPNPFLQIDATQLAELKEQMAAGLKTIQEQYTVNPAMIRQTVKQMGQINSLAVAKDELFVTTGSTGGFGYDIWRTDLDFKNPKKVKAKLGGCCGQLDIQSDGENLLIAENTKFRVGIYNRDGRPVRHFGSQDRAGETGFGSCCNPMNIRCCANGDVLTAESSIGTIKRFDANGKLVGNIGKAKISGGCKHVALAHDEQRDRYYMQYQDASTICVLVPTSEITGETEDEAVARQAREGLGKQLVGVWKKGAGDQPNAIPFYDFTQVAFSADGKLAMTGGNMLGMEEGCTYECIRQNGKQLKVGIYQDKVESFQWTIEFIYDRTLKLGMSYGDTEPQWLGSFVRQAD